MAAVFMCTLGNGPDTTRACTIRRDGAITITTKMKNDDDASTTIIKMMMVTTTKMMML